MQQEPPAIQIRNAMTLVQVMLNAVIGIDKGRKSELSPIAISILYLVYAGPVKMEEISLRFHISRSTATDYINNMEKLGYVTRVRGESDQREIFISPTEKGNRWILDKEARIYSCIDHWLDRLDPEEQEEFTRLFTMFTGYQEGNGIAVMQGIIDETISCSRDEGQTLPDANAMKVIILRYPKGKKPKGKTGHR